MENGNVWKLLDEVIDAKVSSGEPETVKLDGVNGGLVVFWVYGTEDTFVFAWIRTRPCLEHPIRVVFDPCLEF